MTVGRKPALTPEQAQEIREAYADRHPKAKWSVRLLAKSFGVSHAVVQAALNRRGAYRTERERQ
jgi:hypothetical protein